MISKALKIDFTLWLYSGILFKRSPISVIYCVKQKESLYVKRSSQDKAHCRGLPNDS